MDINVGWIPKGPLIMLDMFSEKERRIGVVMTPQEANILVGQLKDAIRRVQFAQRRTRRSFHIKDTGEF